MESTKSKRGSPSRESRSKLFEQIILKSWWVILFFLLCYFAYDQAMHHRTREKVRLEKKLYELKTQKEEALRLQEELKLQIASQEDDNFIELVLMRRLGLVPEGQTKVHFVKRP